MGQPLTAACLARNEIGRLSSYGSVKSYDLDPKMNVGVLR